MLQKELAMSLLSMTPIAKHNRSGDVVSAHALRFDAINYIRQLECNFIYYAASTYTSGLSVSLQIDVLLTKQLHSRLEIPHLGCINYKLAFNVQLMINIPADKRIVKEVQTTMRECKSSTKNAQRYIA